MKNLYIILNHRIKDLRTKPGVYLRMYLDSLVEVNTSTCAAFKLTLVGNYLLDKGLLHEHVVCIGNQTVNRAH